MRYIFEDKDDDLLSVLFKSGYHNTEDFIYAEGHGNLISKLKECIEDGETEIVIFMDMIYDNKNTAQTYKKIVRYVKENKLDGVIIFPIVCSEYYLIRAVYNTSILPNCTDVDICINQDSWSRSTLISTEIDRDFCHNFERYCKLILKKLIADCAKHTRESKSYGDYYTKECMCAAPLSGCKNKSIGDKSVEYLAKYPCVPAGTSAKSKHKLTPEECVKIHRELVDQFNAIVEKHKAMDRDTTKYKTIRYMV